MSALCVAALAQTEIGGATLSGTVRDPSGAAVPLAKVTVTNTQTGFTRPAHASELGLYSFRLPVGSYDVIFQAEGFRSSRHTGVRLTVGATVTVDVGLELGAAHETINVAAEDPVVETARSSAATTVTQKAVAELPVNGRNFMDFTVLTPGVVRDVREGDLSFAGQRGPANTLLVDGADTNNLFWGQAMGRSGFRPYTFSEEAVLEFQVASSSFAAEVGRATGGAINVVTKSGTNDTHGSLFEFYRDKGLNANTFIQNRAGLPKQPYHFNQFGGTLGGRIVKDKLFYFGSYDGQRNKSTQPVAPNIMPTGEALAQLNKYLQPYQLGLNNNVVLAKMDWNTGANRRLSLRYSASRFRGKNYEGLGLNSALEHTGDAEAITDSAVLQSTRVLGARFVWDARFNFSRDDNPGGANGTGVETVIVNGIMFGKRSFNPQYNKSKSWQLVNTLSFLTGRHSVKAGADLLFSRINNFFPGYFAGSYTFASYAAWLARTPLNFRQAFSSSGAEPPINHPNANEIALFLQDAWRAADGLTIHAGLRYDRFGYNQPSTRNPDPGLAAAGLRTDRIPLDNRNLGPRLGLAWKPFTSAGAVIRAGYGIYYGRTPSILRNRVILQNGIDVVTYNLTSNFPAYPNILPAAPASGLAPPDIEVMDPNFKSQATHQFSFQIERALARDYSATIGYLGVRGLHLIRTRDINLYPSELAQGALAGGGTVSFRRHPGITTPLRANPAFGRISLHEAGGDSHYNGGFVQLTKRFSQDFQILGSYVLAKVIDTAPDAIPTPGSPEYDAKATQDTLLPNLDRGPGQNDIRHRLVFSALWDLRPGRWLANPLLNALFTGWQLSTIAQVQSGRPFSVGTSGDPGNDGNNYNDRSPLIGRNTYRGPALMTWDLRLTRSIALHGERMRLRLIAEAFNLTNRANFDSLQMNRYTYRAFVFTPTDNFTSPLSVYSPGVGSRVLQLAAKVTF